MMHATPEFKFDLAEFRVHAFPHGLPKHDEFPISCLVATMRKAKEIERLGLSLATPPTIFSRIATELHQPRLRGM